MYHNTLSRNVIFWSALGSIPTILYFGCFGSPYGLSTWDFRQRWSPYDVATRDSARIPRSLKYPPKTCDSPACARLLLVWDLAHLSQGYIAFYEKAGKSTQRMEPLLSDTIPRVNWESNLGYQIVRRWYELSECSGVVVIRCYKLGCRGEPQEDLEGGARRNSYWSWSCWSWGLRSRSSSRKKGFCS